MSPGQPGAGDCLRAIAFASPDGTQWGAAIFDGERWSLTLGPSGGGSTADGAMRVTEEPDGGWRLAADHASGDDALDLLAVPDEPPAPGSTEDADGQLPPGAAFVPGTGPELCRVTGTASGRPVDWPGVRVQMTTPRSAKEAPGSARVVAGWFQDGSALGLIAARPRRSDRSDADAVSATLFDPERWVAVSDPRLSTTYDGSGTPARVNLELWVGEGEHEYPRRASGEAAGAPSSAAGGETAKGAMLRALPLRCHSHGEEGVGLYVLATF